MIGTNNSLPARDLSKAPRKRSWAFLLPALVILAATALSSAAAEPARVARSASTPPSRPELDSAIDRVLEGPEYSWRMPRPAPGQGRKQEGFIATLIADLETWLESKAKAIGQYLERFGNWLDKLFKPDEKSKSGRDSGGSSFSWPTSPLPFLVVCLTLAACILGIVLFRLWRRKNSATITVATPAPARPDILDENVSAQDLPTDEWRKMASEFMDRGEYRLAIRAMFLAGLARLADNGRITLTRYKSNRDYATELRRKAHDLPPLTTSFTAAVLVLEEVWYGTHTATPEKVAGFTDTIAPIFEDRNAGPDATPA